MLIGCEKVSLDIRLRHVVKSFFFWGGGSRLVRRFGFASIYLHAYIHTHIHAYTRTHRHTPLMFVCPGFAQSFLVRSIELPLQPLVPAFLMHKLHARKPHVRWSRQKPRTCVAPFGALMKRPRNPCKTSCKTTLET